MAAVKLLLLVLAPACSAFMLGPSTSPSSSSSSSLFSFASSRLPESSKLRNTIARNSLVSVQARIAPSVHGGSCQNFNGYSDEDMRGKLRSGRILSLVGQMSAKSAETSVEGTTSSAQREQKWREGQFWNWRTMRVRYACVNPEGKKSPILLIHGFGASIEHWRDNVEQLAVDRPVYAIDLLGFGFSDQPDVPTGFNVWGGHVWAAQICDFIKEVILPASSSKQVILAGNSLGGYSAMLAAGLGSAEGIGGLVLVNSAGPLAEDRNVEPYAGLPQDSILSEMDAPAPPYTLLDRVQELIKRMISFGGFLLTREARIASTLALVYTDDKSRIDDDLVDLIKRPALQPNAFEVFFQTTIGGRGGKRYVTVNTLSKFVEARKIPTLLLWGENDPWITKARADRTLQLMPSAEYIGLKAGHCPHDEVPGLFNEKLLGWLTAKSM